MNEEAPESRVVKAPTGAYTATQSGPANATERPEGPALLTRPEWRGPRPAVLARGARPLAGPSLPARSPCRALLPCLTQVSRDDRHGDLPAGAGIGLLRAVGAYRDQVGAVFVLHKRRRPRASRRHHRRPAGVTLQGVTLQVPPERRHRRDVIGRRHAPPQGHRPARSAQAQLGGQGGAGRGDVNKGNFGSGGAVV